ncbi:helix-turn-helix domain-containing protein [Streptomyces virginiae]|uniref:helix-turn-helix domain-containing protein n=1 Tax=Streptomyces virginiae TaxID=1961 RepID=UPI0035E17082
MTDRKVRRLKEAPDTSVGQLACALRRSRGALGLTQAQAADAIEMSMSTIQRAEAGNTVPKRHVVDGYVAKLGLGPEEADRLFAKATRPAGQQRRSLTQAPHPRMVSTADDLGNALSRVWEEDDQPSVKIMEGRVTAVRVDEKKRAHYAFLSRSAANRIVRRRQLPSDVRQLRSYLYACQVQERRFRVWIEAYHRVKAKEREAAMAKKTAEAEERRKWLGWASRKGAVDIMLEAGFIPAEPFPGSSTAPWTARCRNCGLVSRFRLSYVRQGLGCRMCARRPQPSTPSGATAMPARLTPEVAEQRARAKGWVPAVPYPGAEVPWPGHCAACGLPGAPKYGNFCSPKSAQGPCRPCSGSQKKTETEARTIMLQRSLTPLVPYPGNNAPWESECGKCGGITAPTLSSVRKAIKQGQPKCCDLCRRNGPITAAAAEDLLRLAGAEPLGAFPGIKKPWWARCLNCQQEVAPSLDSIKHAGTGACRFCGGYGISADDDALVYLATHQTLGAAKIGIATVGSRRLDQHRARGWTVVGTCKLSGRHARAVEHAVLSTWKDLALPYGVRPADMPQAGFTETVSLEDYSLEEVQRDLAQALATVPKVPATRRP